MNPSLVAGAILGAVIAGSGCRGPARYAEIYVTASTGDVELRTLPDGAFRGATPTTMVLRKASGLWGLWDPEPEPIAILGSRRGFQTTYQLAMVSEWWSSPSDARRDSLHVHLDLEPCQSTAP